MDEAQIDRVMAGLRHVLHDDLIAAYLFGSAVLGGLRPHSDIDVMAVSARATTHEEKRRLVSLLLASSLRPRPIEVTLVVRDDIRPWRYPPTMDFQYGDWWREEFRRGELEPWGSATNTDLACLVRMVILGDRPLFGPAPREVFDPVPRRDFAAALADGVPALLASIGTDTRNVVLTLARIWSGLETDEVMTKDGAAGWALSRVPAEHRTVLGRARAIYLGEEEERWDDLRPQVGAYAEWVSSQIERIRTRTP